jgi:hypothetical protein
MTLLLHLLLKSDATFGRGDGVAGLVDQEVEHDQYGLPFLRGRTLKGLLVEECANLLFALRQQKSPAYDRFEKAAEWLFGKPGSSLDDDAHMHVGPAVLPDELRMAIQADVKANPPRLKPEDILESLTDIRRQTAVDEATGSPDDHSLRSMRVIIRETKFIAHLSFNEPLNADANALLAACVLSFRRAGTGRNRGRGRLEAKVSDEQGVDITSKHFVVFRQALEEVAK